ncbi:MAG TPA: anti-sigma factor [Gaiellaceae bacterium]
MALRRRREDEAGDRRLAELAALADGTLADERRAALEAEVEASPELAGLLAEQRRAITLARNATAEVEAPATLRSRVEAERPARRLPTARRRILSGAAVAGAAALAVAVGLFGSQTAAERYHAALEPTALAPEAVGEATLTRTSSGWRIELDADGLPRLEGRRYYEAWLRNDAGVLVPLGTFNRAHAVTLWSGVPPEEGAVLAITRELADGDQTTSGQDVLVGTVDGGG